ncbi:MAG: Gfo/Idh/MocA family oxidoreductase [Cyclobacteriaceae bacterium]|jgi:UDP-N-acetyl-2-amino-2-deoxyglucuronate dehydrogenase
MKKFALIGVAGFIAPRHLHAIRETGNTLTAALDKFDSVGILDSYFPQADFFSEFERFDRHLEKLRRQGQKTDYVSICSPNYLHDSHIRFAMRHQADAICEKPLVLNPWNLDALSEIEHETGKKVYTILQLRLHPAIVALKQEIEAAPANKHFEVNLNYITSRGNWYHHSWKGDESKSGGVATNIGIHFFDMLIWIFGKTLHSTLRVIEFDHAAGTLELERATVHWDLSINAHHLPPAVAAAGKRTYRSLRLGEREIEFSDGFTDLHTRSYQQILEGKGFGIADARASIETVYKFRKIN